MLIMHLKKKYYTYFLTTISDAPLVNIRYPRLLANLITVDIDFLAELKVKTLTKTSSG